MPPGRYDEVMSRDRWCQAGAYRFGSSKQCQRQLVVHHKKVKGMGGTPDPAINDADNLVVLCDEHHVEVHANPARSYDCGLLIRHKS